MSDITPDTPDTPEPEAASESAADETFHLGDHVHHVYTGPLDRVVTEGIVVDVLDGDRVRVAWYRGVSGPMDVAELRPGVFDPNEA